MTRNMLSPWADFSPFTIGFNSIFNELDRVRSLPTTNYPPYNIRKGAGEDTFLIELAVAGFSEDDVNVEVKDNNLTVTGELSDKDNGFVHQGISQRAFSRNFVLAEDVVVRGADLANGILTVYAERVVPDEKKVRTVEIGSLPKTTKKQFLVE